MLLASLFGIKAQADHELKHWLKKQVLGVEQHKMGQSSREHVPSSQPDLRAGMPQARA